MFQDFSDFLQKCPTPFHFTQYAREILTDQGYTEWFESNPPEQLPKKSFVIRDERSLLVFNCNGLENATISATHDDSPVLKLKQNYEVVENGYIRLCVNTYGGGRWITWIDRNLRCVGRVFVRESGKIVSKLFDSKKGICIIPSLAVHYDSSMALNPKYDINEGFNPIFGLENGRHFKDYVANTLGVNVQDIVDWELGFVDAKPPSQVDDFILAQRLDNMITTYQCFKAFLNSSPPEGSTTILWVNDNEEIGSNTRCGAQSNFLSSGLSILTQSEKSPENHNKLVKLLSNSFLISGDVNHAIHPSIHSGSGVLQNGITVELNPNVEATCTDIIGSTVFSSAAQKIGAKYQTIISRVNGGGSTLGPYAVQHFGVRGVDAGQAVLAMHSIRESTSISDIQDGINIIKELNEHLTEHFHP